MKSINLIFVIILFVTANSVLPQTDFERWGKAELSYQMTDIEKENIKIERGNFLSMAVYTARQTYKVLISDVDGANCPFYPSCSHFFVESVDAANPLKGYLMFIDRFTRDTNFFKSYNDYAIHETGRFYDPTYLYSLDKENILIHLRKEKSN